MKDYSHPAMLMIILLDKNTSKLDNIGKEAREISAGIPLCNGRKNRLLQVAYVLSEIVCDFEERQYIIPSKLAATSTQFIRQHLGQYLDISQLYY
jgi:hypothetical protein